MRIATASLRTGLAMTPFQEVRWVSLWCVGEGLCPSRGRGNRRSAAGGRRSEAVSRKCPDWRPQQWPGIGWHDGGQENPAPTEAQQEVQWAGDRKGRPYESVTRGAVRRADVGSELSAAGGRGSEVSEWPRSKFPASAVRQRGNFGHRNRIIGPYGVGCREWVTLLVRAVCGASGGNHRDGCGFFWYL